jgi:hypothetical protein
VTGPTDERVQFLLSVIAGLEPAIHRRRKKQFWRRRMDARVTPAHDAEAIERRSGE